MSAAACSDGGDGNGGASDPAEFAAETLEADREIAPSENATTDQELPVVETDDTTPSAVDIPGAIGLDESQLLQNDCFDRVEVLDQGRPQTITTRLRCNESHHFQVFHLLAYPAEHPSVYPGDEVVRQFATESCYREFETWVGQEYEISVLDISVIIPNQEEFEGDNSRYRSIHCLVDRQDGDPMVDTAQGSGW